MRYKKLYPAVICFCVFLAAIGLVLGDPSTVLPGLWKIIVTEDALITDYVKIAGVSAALVNSALVTLVSLLLLYLSKEPPNGFTLVELGLMAVPCSARTLSTSGPSSPGPSCTPRRGGSRSASMSPCPCWPQPWPRW